ncbi:hypothetical protein Ddye_011458 [Dipteronia dyeriana]|uniref:HMA domain-containing protein n=1 Tax=Dipteronia dyeriana TaxID=168575 RepID=A0AAD9X2K3_9ROSI|nr:hypothetical protein Ddye_011458 [Dipteronia dyeriana]
MQQNSIIMKQKVVIKVSVHRQKCRSIAMKTAVGASGVESATLKGDDKSQIEVTGDGIDAAEITRLLRKKFRYAFLESVSAAASGGDKKKEDRKEAKIELKGGDKKESGEKKNEDKKEAKMELAWPPYYHATEPHYYNDVHHVVRDSYYDYRSCRDSNYRCSVM